MSDHAAEHGEHAPLVPALADHGALAMTAAELRDWGRRFGRSTHPPLVVTLSGELGAGKTTLVQAICEGYGVSGEVTSPTFALVHEYEAPRSTVYHLDLYRLDRPRLALARDWLDWFGRDPVTAKELDDDQRNAPPVPAERRSRGH